MSSHLPSTLRHQQRGVVLIVALIVLVAMAMASIALVRSVDVATQVAGNLAFRQSGVQAADSAVEQARNWLMLPDVTNQLNGNISPGLKNPRYYATWDGGGAGEPGTPVIFDPADANPNHSAYWTKFWKDVGDERTWTTDAAGNTAVYVVHRMCEKEAPLDDPTQTCRSAPSLGLGNSNLIKGGEESRCSGTLCTAIIPYYRITVRVSGPRNTVTYIQAVIY